MSHCSVCQSALPGAKSPAIAAAISALSCALTSCLRCSFALLVNQPCPWPVATTIATRGMRGWRDAGDGQVGWRDTAVGQMGWGAVGSDAAR